MNRRTRRAKTIRKSRRMHSRRMHSRRMHSRRMHSKRMHSKRMHSKRMHSKRRTLRSITGGNRDFPNEYITTSYGPIHKNFLSEHLNLHSQEAY